LEFKDLPDNDIFQFISLEIPFDDIEFRIVHPGSSGELNPDILLENAVAMYNAIKKYGRYPIRQG
jgi:hypothetical protein